MINNAARIIGLIVLAFLPAVVIAQNLSGNVDIRWYQPTGFLTSSEAVFHEGETIRMSAGGTVCYAHYSGSRTETTLFIFKKNIPVEEHHDFTPATAGVLVSAFRRGGDVSVVGALVGSAQNQLQLPMVAPNAAYELRAYIPFKSDPAQENPEERSRSHGTYNVTAAIDVSRRLTLIQNLVEQISTGGRVTPEAAFQELLCEHVRRAAPSRVGQLVAAYVAARKSRRDLPIDNAATELLISDVLKLDPTNSALRFELIDMLLASAEYERARQSAQDAVRTYRQLLQESPSAETGRALGQSLLRLAAVFEAREAGLSSPDLAVADSTLKEATDHLRRAGDLVALKDGLIRRATVLGRFRTPKSLEEAARALEEALAIVGEVVTP